jgi:starch synthase
MRVLFVTSEIYPLAKTGGLADVSQALPAALSRLGVDIQLMMPAYPGALDLARGKRCVAVFDDLPGGEDVRLIRARTPDNDLPVWLVDCPALYDRDGGLYQDANGVDWPDNARRFALLSHVAVRLGLGQTPVSWRPDVVHANDWHAGLAPALLAVHAPYAIGNRATCNGILPPASVFTIHNMAFHGAFEPGEVAHLAAPIDPAELEFYGRASFLKGGIRFADRITTVSPTYAREILSPGFGHGLDGLLRHRAHRLAGILNGVDYGIWNPAHDTALAQRYTAEDISGKRICKAQLQKAYGLKVDPAVPLVAYMSRLTEQKMADCVLEALDWIAGRGAQFILVGQGDRALEDGLRAAGDRLAEVAIQIGYDEPSAHRLLAGADILLAPSRFEPCGLTQLYALKYGTVPVVSNTGGLADTVINADEETMADESANGFVFDQLDTTGLIEGLGRALGAFSYPLSWRRLQVQAMTADFSWRASARRYLSLYQGAAGVEEALAARPAIRQAI